MTLITRNRISALARINRWRGWTIRPFAACEHTTIGVEVMRQHGYSVLDQRAFLLHDMHETQFVGDVPTPDKRAYLNDAFHDDVKNFDIRLSLETGIPYEAMTGVPVKNIDNVMLCAEHRTIAVTQDPEVRMDDSNPEHLLAADIIRSDTHRGDIAIELWWDHYRRLWG